MKLIKVPLKNIVVQKDRGRKEFKNIMELSESIKKLGFINPICVSTIEGEPDKFELIAGERRWRAAMIAGLSEVPVTFRDQQSPLERKIMELEENTHREDLDWAEQCILHEQIDTHRRLSDPTWKQEQTAELVGVSRNHVNLQINMAKKLRDNPELAKEIKARNLPINAAAQVIKQHEQTERLGRLMESGQIKITTDLRCGDARDLIKLLPSASVDLCITDPPYGLEKLEAIRESGGTKMSGHALMSEHHNSDIASVLQLLRAMAPELIRVLKPGAHFYCFTALQYIGEFVEALKPLEFQPPVVIWDREKPTTPGYGYNYLNSTEAIIMFHNPPRQRRLAKSMYNILRHPEVPKNLRVYPTEKPQSLLKDLIGQSSVPGELILDWCAGSGSTLKAARALGRKSIGFEIDPQSWAKTQLHLSGQANDPEPSLLPSDQPKVLIETARS